ncbi:MAG: 50S ribosomal protein L32 [Chloroflexota bacterium]
MGALPKRKTSKARRDKRRSHHSIEAPNLDTCPQCHTPKLPHHTCPTCGTYAGRQVITVERAKKSA